MKQPYLRLTKEIEFELSELKKIVIEGNELSTRFNKEIPGSLEIRGLGAILHDFYNGIENICKRIANEIDGGLPKGDDWHWRVLESMALDLPELRPALFSVETLKSLDEYRRFRHIFRHMYGSHHREFFYLLKNLIWVCYCRKPRVNPHSLGGHAPGKGGDGSYAEKVFNGIDGYGEVGYLVVIDFSNFIIYRISHVDSTIHADCQTSRRIKQSICPDSINGARGLTVGATTNNGSYIIFSRTRIIDNLSDFGILQSRVMNTACSPRGKRRY